MDAQRLELDKTKWNYFIKAERKQRGGRARCRLSGGREVGTPVGDGVPEQCAPGEGGVRCRERGRWPEQRQQELRPVGKRRWRWRLFSKWRERGKGKNGITSTRRSWWREGLACDAPVREIGRTWQ
uniref:Uncharacterized protein n=1 Tax=Oryza rufipogon TaxID=4529 RepID=A0A0E0RH72_ORYRU